VTGEAALTPFDALLLGLVEGITEYLPVSSTGHLILASAVIGRHDDPALKSFAIVIQLGAILAVLGLYQARVVSMLRGLVGRDAAGRRLLSNMIISFIPAAVLGLAFGGPIKERLFAPLPVAIALALGGLAIFAFEPLRARRATTGGTVEDVSPRGALLIGFSQCLALWPGTSRSLVTILAGLGAGLRPAAAAEYSFVLGMLTLGAATLYELVTEGAMMLEGVGAMPLVVGLLVSFASAAVAVKGFVAWLGSRGLAPFGVYRLLLAAAVWLTWS